MARSANCGKDPATAIHGRGGFGGLAGNATASILIGIPGSVKHVQNDESNATGRRVAHRPINACRARRRRGPPRTTRSSSAKDRAAGKAPSYGEPPEGPSSATPSPATDSGGTARSAGGATRPMIIPSTRQAITATAITLSILGTVSSRKI